MSSQVSSKFVAYLSLINCGIYLIFWHIFECFKDISGILLPNSGIPLKHVRLQRILWRHKSRQEIARREDFVTTDNGFISKKDLLSPNWTVYSLDKKGAIFIELPKPLLDYSIDKYPFIKIPIFKEALRVVEIDLESYIALGSQLEADANNNNTLTPKSLFFSNTARCASTLFGAMLHHPGNSIVIAEHPALIILSIGYKDGYWSENDINALLSPTIKFFRKGMPSNQTFIYKTSSCETEMVPFLAKFFPEMKHIFMFRRNGLDSVERVVARDYATELLFKLYNISPALATCFGFLAATEGSLQRRLKPWHVKEFSMLIYGGPYLIYKQNKEIFDFPIVWHDELMAAPKEILKPIFAKLEIPESCFKDAMAKMEVDSQADTFLRRENLESIPITLMTPELKVSLQKYAKILLMEEEVLGF